MLRNTNYWTCSAWIKQEAFSNKYSCLMWILWKASSRIVLNFNYRTLLVYMHHNMVEIHWFIFLTALLLFQWVSYLHGEISWYAVLTFDVRVPYFKKLWIWRIFCCCQEIKNKSPKALCAEIFKGPCLLRTVFIAQRWTSSPLLDVLVHLAWHPAVVDVSHMPS